MIQGENEYRNRMNSARGKQMPVKQEQLCFSKHMAEQANSCNLQALCVWCLKKQIFLCYPYVGAKAHSVYSLPQLQIRYNDSMTLSLLLVTALDTRYTVL